MIEQPRAPCDTPRVNDLPPLCLELLSKWLLEIPLVSAMGIQIAGYDDDGLRVRAPLEENRNLHGTAFAGSLFSVCVLTGWGATWLPLRLAGLTGQIVASESRIRYRKAVAGEIVCLCRPDPAVLAQSLSELRATGRMSLALTCTIDANDKRAVTFEGTYVVHAEH